MHRRLTIVLAVLLIPNLAMVSWILYATVGNRISPGDGSADGFAARAARNWSAAVNDKDPDVRILAIQRLAQQTRDGTTVDVLPALRSGLRDSHASVRRMAGEGLRWLGEPGVNELVAALDDNRQEVRISAAKMLLWTFVDKTDDVSRTKHDKGELANRVLAEAGAAESKRKAREK